MRRWFFVLLVFGVDALAAEQSWSAQPADVIFLGGHIVTVNETQPTADAIAISNGKIIAVGQEPSIQKLKGPSTRVIRLEDHQTLLPGMIESHAHLISFGEALMTLDLSDQTSWEGVMAAVSEAAATTPKGAWIVGNRWHQSKWDSLPGDAVKGYPVHDRLSELTPDHPVLLTHASYHAVFANEAAMKIAGINDETPDSPGGTILRHPDGKATGTFLEKAGGLIQRARARSQSGLDAGVVRQRFAKAVDLATRACWEHGVTTFSDAGLSVAAATRLIQLADENGLGMRVHVMIRDSNENLRRHLADLKRIDSANGFLTIRGIKKSIDGALGSHGAWLLQPYLDRPASRGLATLTTKQVREAAEIAIEHDFQLCVHAIGDRANRETLDIFEGAAGDKNLAQRRWRIEHAQHLNPDDIPRFGRLGVIASIQGVHCTSDSVFVPARLGYRRSAEGAFVWRSLIDSGALLCNGTDAPVEAISPFECLESSLTRTADGAEAFFPDQAMTRQEALASYTINAAQALFAEASRGSIETGKLADLIVIDADWENVPADQIGDIEVQMTMVGGKIVYEKE